MKGLNMSTIQSSGHKIAHSDYYNPGGYDEYENIVCLTPKLINELSGTDNYYLDGVCIGPDDYKWTKDGVVISDATLQQIQEESLNDDYHP
jgi:hypothetical protein